MNRNIYFNVVRNVFTTLIFLLTMVASRAGRSLHISDDDFVRIRRPRQQVANRGWRIFRMSEHELAFVERVLTRKPNLQIYRTHQAGMMGDFVIIDHSNQQYVVGWVIELKTASGSAHAGVQLLRAAEAAKHLELNDFMAVTGNPDEMMAILTRGRGSWRR